VIGGEQAAKGTTVDLGPTINIVRDPRWGRAFESVSEDPYLAGTMGAADIRGVQSTGTMAQVKHLAVYNQETNRNTPSDNAIVSTQAEQEIYLPAFGNAVQQGAASSVMCSYSTVNGSYACQNPYLLTTALRQQFGFGGFVTSDWGATHSTAASANAGLDMDMPGNDGYFGSALQSAVSSGSVSTATLNSMASDVLTEMFAFGLFDKPTAGSPRETATGSADSSDALQLAEEGTVLLKNSGGVLPLTSSDKSIALFPFGYGLSYTSFSFSNLKVGTLPAAGAATVTATVTNTGSRAGADVAQLHVSDPSASGQPPRQLEGFARVSLQPGASQPVTFQLTQQNLQYWNSSSNGWATSTGSYSIKVGDSDANLPLTGTLSVSSAQLGQPVTITSPGPQEGLAGTAVSVPVSAKDSTSGQSLSFTATGLPAGTSISGSGTISGTPATAGTSTVTVTAQDGNGALASTSFTWTVLPSGDGIATTPLAGYQGLCLDIASDSNAPGTKVDIYTCNGTDGQQWTEEPNGTVRADGDCLDVEGGGTANGTLVDLYTCNGTGAQVWPPQSDGALLNPQSGKCLDDTGYSTSPGTQVQIWSCTGNSNQSWVSPAG
jgi:beta-glucosidase-like glycosyl hydrolase